MDDSELAMVKGGFTYALSTGRVCKLSIGMGWGKEVCQELTPSYLEAHDEAMEEVKEESQP